MDDAVRRVARELVLPTTRQQIRVLSQSARFTTVYANRRWGKSTAAKGWVIKQVSQPDPFGLLWWVVPTYKQLRSPFNSLLAQFSRAGLVVDARPSEYYMRLATGWRVEGRTAEQPHNLRGEGVKALVADEAARISDTAFNEAIRPTLSDNRGKLFAISTPAGRVGWMYRYWALGNEKRPGYASYKFDAYDAIFVPPDELEEARATMSPRAFAQEFMCEFLDGEGVVFEGISSRPRFTSDGVEPVGIGADWAKKVDWTWFVAVGQRSGAILDVRRLPQHLPYPEQVRALVEFTKPYVERGYFLCYDRTGVGEAVGDLLAEAKLDGSRAFDETNTEGIIWTSKEKHELVEEAVVDFSSGKLGLPPKAETINPDYNRMLGELAEFTMTLSPTGKIVYGAPEGRHDDGVAALLMGNRARRRLAQVALEFEPRFTQI